MTKEYIERGALEAQEEGCGNHDKIKTSFAQIIVGGEVEKPYYSILWLDEASREYYIGYSSYYLAYVRKWLEEEFEVIEEPVADVVPRTAYDQVVWERDLAIEQLREDYGVGLGEKKSADVVEVKHGEWDDTGRYKFPGGSVAVRCSECGCCLTAGEYRMNVWNYCPVCGARMDGGADNG